MKIGIIIGSNRPESQSERIANKMSEVVQLEHPTVTLDTFSLKELNIPLWTQDKWSDESEMSIEWKSTSDRVRECDGFVVITPEWAGMATPHLKNFLLMCDSGELAHKPGLLVSVSAGMGGAYPIAELRMSGYKNNYIWWTPDHIILRNVSDLFNSEDDASKSLQERMSYCLNFLVSSADALKPVREKCQNLNKYEYGM